jgi:hypothetical protein
MATNPAFTERDFFMSDKYETRLAPIEIEYQHRETAKALTVAGVGVQILLCVVAGLGAAVVSGVALLWLQAPESWLYSVPVFVGLFLFGLLLLVRAIPWEKAIPVRRYMQFQREAQTAAFQAEEAFKRLRQMDINNQMEMQRLSAAHAQQVLGLQRTIDRVTLERDQARLELQRMRNVTAGRRDAYVPKERQQGQEERDARTIVEYWFTAGLPDPDARVWLPRRDAPKIKAMSEGRHTAAVGLLKRAGIAVDQEVVVEPMDAALQQLTDYVVASGQRPIEAAPLDWEE